MNTLRGNRRKKNENKNRDERKNDAINTNILNKSKHQLLVTYMDFDGREENEEFGSKRCRKNDYQNTYTYTQIDKHTVLYDVPITASAQLRHNRRNDGIITS